jgi:hypothetical protein
MQSDMTSLPAATSQPHFHRCVSGRFALKRANNSNSQRVALPHRYKPILIYIWIRRIICYGWYFDKSADSNQGSLGVQTELCDEINYKNTQHARANKLSSPLRTRAILREKEVIFSALRHLSPTNAVLYATSTMETITQLPQTLWVMLFGPKSEKSHILKLKS